MVQSQGATDLGVGYYALVQQYQRGGYAVQVAVTGKAQGPGLGFTFDVQVAGSAIVRNLQAP
ncbi:hypothetical protein D3C80_1931770 [compost metagenome]